MSDGERSPSSARVARGLPPLVVLSGASALVYQSLWMRSFGLIFGNTTDAVAMVLVVFMGGLALGSGLAARWRSADPLRGYGLVELGIGGAGLLSLPLLRALPWAYGTLAGRLGLEGLLELSGRTLLASVVLLPATVLLGMTIPLAIETLARVGRPVHATFGRLYLLNTLGGAAGVALGPFVLVPLLGVSGTLTAAAAGSLAAGGLALAWRHEGPLPEAPVAPIVAEGATSESSAPPRTTMSAEGERPTVGPLLAALSGAATFGVEVLWTRSYALVIGSSIYAFNLILLAVLLGIAGGAFLYGRLRPRVRHAARAAGALFCVAAGTVLAGQWVIGKLPLVYLAALGALPLSFLVHQVAGLALCLATMLPVTLLLGMTFPLLLHLSDTSASAQQASARLYAWNTGGAIAGALAADLALVPGLGLQPSFLVFASLLLGGGVLALGEGAGWPPLVKRLAPVGLVVALAVLAPRWSPWDPVVMSSGVHRYGLEWRERLGSALDLGDWLREQRSLVFYREGSEAVVAVSESDGERRFLSVNGKTDAGSGAEDVVTQRFIAHVPMLLHRDPQRALVIGWGAGATAASIALYPEVEAVECVEIEPAVFEAASYFPELGGGLVDDPRFRISFRDGRNHLLRATESWDVVVSEPSNPWISGVSNLFTLEFYEIVKSHLAPGGIFGQWFHYYNLQALDVRVEVKTFLEAFPHASLWLVPPVQDGDGRKSLGADLLLVGSLRPHALDWDRLVARVEGTRVAADLRATRVLGGPLSFVASWAMGRREMVDWVESAEDFAAPIPLNTDDRPYIEFVAPKRTLVDPAAAAEEAARQYGAMSAAAGDARSILEGRLEPDAAGAEVAAFLRELAESYIAAEQPQRALRALDAASEAVPGEGSADVRAAELLLERGHTMEALGRLRSAVRTNPGNVRAWDLLGQLAIDRKDYLLAESAHRAILRREPGNVSAWLRLGAVLARQGKWREAREALGWARSLDPEAPVDPELEDYLATRIAEAAALGR